MTCGPVCRGRGWWVPLGLGWSTKKREATWPHAAPDSFCGPYPDEGSCRSVVLVRLFAQNLRISSLGLVLGKLREVHQYDTCSQTLDTGTLPVSLGSRRRVDNDQTSAEDSAAAWASFSSRAALCLFFASLFNLSHNVFFAAASCPEQRSSVTSPSTTSDLSDCKDA